jgi:hypothetical protein
MFTFSLFVFFTPCLFEFIFKYKIGVYRLCELYSVFLVPQAIECRPKLLRMRNLE